MSIERINPKGMYKPNRGIYSQVTIAKGSRIVAIAGTVPWDENLELISKDDMAAQVATILGN